MANYSLVINSKFKPFSFQEFMQPVLMATQAHQAIEDQYADLASKANIWDKLTNPETDQRAHSIYSAYAADLERQADELARNGLNPSSRQQMLNMRARYARDITPIEAAYRRREEQIAEQRKAGNSMIYDYDAGTTSLDRFLENPALSYKSIDRRDLYTRAVTDFGQYAKALQDYGNGKRLDQFTKTFVQRYGITPEDARSFIVSMREGKINEADPTLRAVYDALYNSTGVNAWNNTQAQNTVRETILEGVGAAIGKSTVSPYEDKGAVMAQQLANSKALAQYQMDLQQAAQEAQRMRMYDVNPTSYYSQDEITRQNKPIVTQLDKWKNKGYFDSNGRLTSAGKEALNYRVVIPGISITEDYYIGGETAGDREFYNWAKGLSGIPVGVDGVTGPAVRIGDEQQLLQRNVSTYYNSARRAVANGTLATGTANFQVYRQRLGTQADQQVVAREISAALGNDGTIYQAGQLSGGAISKGGGVSASDFASKLVDNPIIHIINSPTTGRSGQQLIELANGEKYLLPAGIIGNNTQANLNAANLAIRGAGSTAEAATNLNRANAYLASILTTTTGTEIKPNDGTITIDLGLGGQ